MKQVVKDRLIGTGIGLAAAVIFGAPAIASFFQDGTPPVQRHHYQITVTGDYQGPVIGETPTGFVVFHSDDPTDKMDVVAEWAQVAVPRPQGVSYPNPNLPPRCTIRDMDTGRSVIGVDDGRAVVVCDTRDVDLGEGK